MYMNTHQVWEQTLILPTAGKYHGEGLFKLMFEAVVSMPEPSAPTPLRYDGPTGSNGVYIEDVMRVHYEGGTDKKGRLHVSQ